jgi:hypothetical protein
MRRRDLLVSAVVATLCSAILVIFTEVEDGPQDWLRCRLPAAGSANRALCR